MFPPECLRWPIPASHLRVYLALCSFSRGPGTACWPSQAALAARAGVTDRTVRRALRALEERDLVRTHRHGGRNGTNHYEVNWNPRWVVPLVRGGEDTALSGEPGHIVSDKETMNRP